MRFLIRGPQGQEFEMTDVDYFLDEHEPNGFAIVTHPPSGYDVPDVKAAKAERRDAAKAATAETPTTTTTPPPKKG